LAGLLLSLGWQAGGPAWMAIAGLLADEIDGRVARATNTQSEFGSFFDWVTDVGITQLVLARLGAARAIPLVLFGQVYLRGEGVRPDVGSARAVLTLYALATHR
jgi:phosphatidylglycerophosphate synthase